MSYPSQLRNSQCWNRILMLPHSLTYFEIQKYYLNKPRFNVVHSRNNLPKIKDGAYVIHLDEYKSIQTHWIASCENGDRVTYFDSFRVKEIKKFMSNKNIKNIYKIQAYD